MSKYSIFECGTSSILDLPYDTDKFHFTKQVHIREPRFYDQLANCIDKQYKPDVVIYSRGILSGSPSQIIDVNLNHFADDMDYWISKGIKNHLVMGSVCGLPDNTYDSKKIYEYTKKLQFEIVKYYREKYPNRNIVYLALPGIQSSMTINSSGYLSYLPISEGNKIVMSSVEELLTTGGVTNEYSY